MIYRLLPFLMVVSFAYANLEPLPRFDWNSLMEAVKEVPGGSQILHFNTSDKPIENNPEALAFKNAYLQGALACNSDAEVLRAASDAVQIEGVFIEVGTKAGKNANFLAALNPKQTIYSFDSSNGLPLDWIRSDRIFPAGSFAYKSEDLVPPVLHNVVLYRGSYSEMLSQLDDTPIALLHVDCEIYASTKNVLKALSKKIVTGTVIVFDEAYNYPGSKEHEWKAFLEFCSDHNFTYKTFAYNQLHEQVALMMFQL